MSARVLGNRLQIVISDLVGPAQNFVVKGRSISDNQPLVPVIREGIEDDIELALISLDQSKVFDRVDHWFLAAVFGDRRIRTGIPQMDQHSTQQHSGSGAGEGKALGVLRDWAVGLAGLSPVSSSLRPCLGGPAL